LLAEQKVADSSSAWGTNQDPRGSFLL